MADSDVKWYFRQDCRLLLGGRLGWAVLVFKVIEANEIRSFQNIIFILVVGITIYNIILLNYTLGSFTNKCILY